jgi:hypothetical protein
MCAYELKEFLEGLDDYALVLGHPDLSKKVYEEAEPPERKGNPAKNRDVGAAINDAATILLSQGIQTIVAYSRHNGDKQQHVLHFQLDGENLTNLAISVNNFIMGINIDGHLYCVPMMNATAEEIAEQIRINVEVAWAMAHDRDSEQECNPDHRGQAHRLPGGRPRGHPDLSPHPQRLGLRPRPDGGDGHRHHGRPLLDS